MKPSPKPIQKTKAFLTYKMGRKSALGLFFPFTLLILSSCGPSGPLTQEKSDAWIEPQVEEQIAKEVETEFENQAPDEYLPDQAMTREELIEYLDQIKKDRIQKRKEKYLEEKAKEEEKEDKKKEDRKDPIVEVPNQNDPIQPPSDLENHSTQPETDPVLVDQPPIQPDKEPEKETSPEKQTQETGDDLGELLQSHDVVYRPRSEIGFTLAAVSEHLASLTSEDYLKIQFEHIGSKVPACNYFAISAMAESHYFDEGPNAKKVVRKAARLDDGLFIPSNGWKKIDLKTLRSWIKEGRVLDAVFQNDPPKGKTMGHVGIFIGLDQNEKFISAEGTYDSTRKAIKPSNRIVKRTDQDLSWRNIFVRTPEEALASL